MKNQPKKLSVRSVRLLEEKAKSLGLTERLLIENASSNLAHRIVSLNLGKKAVAVSGKGNNGADVLACARKLLSQGLSVKAAMVSEAGFSQEVDFQRKILESLGVKIVYISSRNAASLEKYFHGSDFIIDGLLGIGAIGRLSPLLKKVIRLINKSKLTIVSCDIPSGLSPDEGRPLGAAVRADYTVTFLAAKKGFATAQGKFFCGELSVVDIGISAQALQKK